MKDVLDLFEQVSGEQPKDYPGNLKPKNRGERPPAPKPDKLELLESLPSKEYLIQGVATKCYTVGALCKVLERKPVTIRSWETKGLMPKPKIRTAPPASTTIPGKTLRGRRLYTYNQMVFLIEAYERFKLDDPKGPLATADWDGFRTHMRNYPNT